MGLIAWYPLNGDVKDKLGGPSLTGTFTSDTSGKTGSCAKQYKNKLSGSNSDLVGCEEFSLAMWLYYPSTESSSAWSDVFGIKVTNGTTSTDLRTEVYSSTNNTALNAFCNGVLTNDGGSGNFVFELDKWQHLVLVKTKTHIKVYIDGINKINHTIGSSYSGTVTAVGTFHLSDTTFNGKYNDFRIYDHELSLSEINRLAEGLVLHYDFENPHIEATTNLITSITSGGRTSIINNGTTVLTNGENADTYFYLKLSKTLEAGKTYTLSCTGEGIITNTDGHGDYFRFGLQGQGGVPQISIYNGRSSLTFVATSTQAVNSLLLDDITGHRCLTQCKFYDWQLEEKDHATPYTKTTRSSDVCYDSSGYGHHATVAGSPQIVEDSPSGTRMIYTDGGVTLTTDKIFTDNTNQCHTVSFWVKPTEIVGASHLVNFNSGYRVYHSTSGTSLCYLNSGTNDSYVYGKAVPINTWTHITWVVDTDNVICKVYYNGVLNATSTNYTSTDVPAGFSASTVFLKNLKGYIADIKIYATAFSADQVKKLYEVKARANNNGSLSAGQFVEYGENIAFQSTVDLFKGVQSGYWTKVEKDSYAPNGTGGLGKYTQTNCSVTYENGECHIYSAPNLTTSANGNTMWGGLCWSPMKIASNVLQDGHRYIITWHMRGKSSSSMDIGWHNYIGWDGASSNPTPTLNGSLYPSTFNDYDVGINCYYDFTINDTVFKEHTATTGNTNFVAGTTYLSYSGFKIGYAYGNTGANGRDVYISNLQMFDITYLEEQHPGIKSDDVFKLLFMEEKNGNMKIYHGGHVGATEFIEI